MNYLLIAATLISFFGTFSILGIKENLFITQLIYLIVGLVFFWIIKKIGRNFFLINSHILYWILVAVLIITFAVGVEVKGSKRWIDFYFFRFQPSEFLKVFFVLFISQFLSLEKTVHNSLKSFLKILVYFLIPAAIIYKQPDLGNALVYAFVFVIMLLNSHLPKRYLFYLLLIGALIFPLGWHYIKPYQKQRIVSFFNPQVDTQGNAYNMLQSVISIGSGKFTGRGLGRGTQSRLYFLPENRTDFAFASLVEQFGFFGGFIILLLYSVIILNLAVLAVKYFFQKTTDRQGSFLYIMGILSLFLFQTAINIGMNMGIAPVAGIALPFISYGGSSLVTFMIGLALLPK